MIDFYYWPTPNGQKVSILLEETGLEYELKPVNILKGEQFSAEFLAINPNNKIPAIVDHEGPEGGPFTVFESGAVMLYLAEKAESFLPESAGDRYDVLQWLMFQVGGVGPMFGQCGHFLGYAPEKIPYAIERYQNETLRLYGVMEERLADNPYLGGASYSIADMATHPWVHVRWLHEIDIDRFPNVKRWYETLLERPAVERGYTLLAEEQVIGNPSDETREAFFGQTQLNRGPTK